MAFGQEPMPTGVFASDQYKPLVRYAEPEQTGDRPPALGSGLTSRRLHLIPKSWSLTRIQRQSPTWCHSRRVWGQAFNVRDLVLRLV